MVSQNVLNLVDTAMVGRLGSTALAAVGFASFVVFMSVAILQGLGAGVQAISARRLGEKRDSEVAFSLNSGLILSLICGLPLSAVLWAFAPDLLSLLNSDQAILDEMIPYYRLRVLSAVAIGCNFSFRGFWNGTNRPKLYLWTLVIMHISNIFLNWVFIFGNLGSPEMGVEGAALASVICTYIGTATYFILGMKHARGQGFLSRKLEGLSSLGRLSLPAGLQQFFLAAGFTCLFWIIGLVGASELAAANVIINLNLVGILPSLGFGLAAASLVGQALGAGDTADAKRWCWDVVRVTLAVVFFLALPMIFLPEWLLGLFIMEPSVVAVGVLPLRLAGLFLFAEGIGLVVLNALMGAGATRTTMLIAVLCQWGIGLPMAYFVGPYLGYGLLGVWVSQGLYRILQGVLFSLTWQRGRWAEIKL